ncbi:molecular chaperone HscC [Arenimonas oryziterrae]|uniref:Molecular chaperone HscC n=1 Tax=Arenimonas oryziterrae DSM 21050 = YC6267 TaxID=1121015 RepID=A0A091APZ8_9GAMM|nr:molecular chaperone HscC [Arenimonas oryziterrae]KFN41064.1 hypothetical protein N789_04045 [Arenimonas oryziterrae DSM 21050 = YC6267]
MLVGIDLGTTHSLIGVYGPDGPRLIPNALGEFLTPSAISVDPDGTVLVGRAARDRLVTQPGNSVAAFKRWMGTPRETRLGKKSFRPEELSALVLRSLVADAEAHLGEKITEAVISVPAYFGDAQRKATRAAGELAGLRVERLINEPTAAALAYGLQERLSGSTFIVLDLGGGTFDVSILEIFDGVMQVHASAGDNHLGGEDFLELMLQACCADWQLKPESLAPPLRAQLLSKLERAKRQLTGKGDVAIEAEIDGQTREWRLGSERFEALAEPLVQRLRQPIERAMRDAKLRPDQLNEILLVGGASRMPVVARLVARMLGRLPMRHVDPDQAIALGACVAAGMKARDAALEEIVMTDVCPYTLGVEISRRDADGRITPGVFSPIIERNCSVPVSRAETYQPMQANQTLLELNVFQGESPLVANNIRLGQLQIKLPPKREPTDNIVEVRFTYDVNGVLQVEATVLSTGGKHELILQQNAGVLTQAEIRSRLDSLAALKVHPRDHQENLALIARADRLYAESLGATREQVQQWLVQFIAELDRQDMASIARHRQDFSAALDALEASFDE